MPGRLAGTVVDGVAMTRPPGDPAASGGGGGNHRGEQQHAESLGGQARPQRAEGTPSPPPPPQFAACRDSIGDDASATIRRWSSRSAPSFAPLPPRSPTPPAPPPPPLSEPPSRSPLFARLVCRQGGCCLDAYARTVAQLLGEGNGGEVASVRGGAVPRSHSLADITLVSPPRAPAFLADDSPSGGSVGISVPAAACSHPSMVASPPLHSAPSQPCLDARRPPRHARSLSTTAVPVLCTGAGSSGSGGGVAGAASASPFGVRRHGSLPPLSSAAAAAAVAAAAGSVQGTIPRNGLYRKCGGTRAHAAVRATARQQ